jgi:hypothetical protein
MICIGYYFKIFYGRGCSMEILSAALAFAITMLVLAMVVSAFVELIHRILSMRESGLQYMLQQTFDQVLSKYCTQEAVQRLTPDLAPRQPGNKFVEFVRALGAMGVKPETATETLRRSFVERMSTNRAPMGVPPDATPTDHPAKVQKNACGGSASGAAAI